MASPYPSPAAAEVDRRPELIGAGRRLADSGLVRARSGNLSIRAGGGLLVTMAGARLGALAPSDLLTIADPAAPPPHASSEMGLHAAIYAARPDVGAVVHTHSAYATAWATVEAELPLTLEDAPYYGMGDRVAVVEHLPAGSRALADAAVAALGAGAAVLLARHGAIAVGADLSQAVDIAESLEHQARVAWLLRGEA